VQGSTAPPDLTTHFKILRKRTAMSILLGRRSSSGDLTATTKFADNVYSRRAIFYENCSVYTGKGCLKQPAHEPMDCDGELFRPLWVVGQD
jgi:hypothetical protein